MLNDEQQVALDIVLSGKNAFITGNAGTGKSYLTSEIIKELKSRGKNVVVCAPTGIAAIHIGGATIHRAFSLKSDMYSFNNTLISSVILNADVIIIDEISMCRIDLFDMVATIIRSANAKREKKGKGKIQLIVVGDFYQLPPVMTDKDKDKLRDIYGSNKSIFAFASPKWRMFNFENIILRTIVRQRNVDTCTALNLIRVGDLSGVHYFNNYSSKTPLDGAVTICGTNSKADEINEFEVNRLPGTKFTSITRTTGTVYSSDKVVNDTLELKVGARVLLLINTNSYVNGDTGEVAKISSDKIFVKLDRGIIVKVEKHTWEVMGYIIKGGKPEKAVVGTYTQFPIRLGYAITIHKSQGQTLLKANINPYSWASGQLYVALSRVATIEGIYLTQKISNDFVKVAPEVAKFYDSIV